jgi:hypothetical protein
MLESRGRKGKRSMARAEKRQTRAKRLREVAPTGAALPQVVPPVDRELVEQAVRYINDVAARTIEKGFQGTLEIGRYVLEKFYDNDPVRVRFRGPQKETSFRELENHPELQLSRSSLHNAVGLAIQEHHLLEAGKGQVPGLVSATHRVALLGIRPSDDKDKKAVLETSRLKLKLMQEVAERGLSVRQLQDRIAEMAGKLITAGSLQADEKDERRGPRLPKLIENILAVPFEKIVKKKRLAEMSAGDRKRYRTALEKAVDRLTKMIEQIDAIGA